ncbi:DUF6325 family protein [Aeromicrobium massiliense]|uniref:DUF6325 family protein n=1 Tax=Aeromicrobium massiliense TaxID=1464554 RepID=UPI000309B871|nr:DUF6325 family protein [Aeromicrobium massiliense]
MPENDETPMGPVDYLVVEFPGNHMTGEGLAILVDLADQGIIRILDLTFVSKDADGTVTGMEIGDFDGDGELDLSVFAGVATGLLDEDDRASAGAVLEPDSAAAILLYENVWAAPFVAALHGSQARLVASGRIPADELFSAVEATEPTSTASDSATAS